MDLLHRLGPLIDKGGREAYIIILKSSSQHLYKERNPPDRAESAACLRSNVGLCRCAIGIA